MTSKEEILAYLSAQKMTLFTDYQLTKLGLFGSFAAGTATAASDIDIIVEFQPETPDLHYKKASIKSLVEQQFGRAVDICREKYLKPYYRQQILKTAIYV